MDIRSQIPEPELEGIDRVWSRFEASRAQEPGRRRRRMWAGVGIGMLAAAAALAVVLWPEPTRSIEVASAVTPVQQTWSEQIQFEAVGEGAVEGTRQDAVVQWETGTIRAQVAPNTGTQLSVVTDEARVDVLGTVFTVHRDALGSTVSVERGRVAVTCEDGWEGTVDAAAPARTCLPVTAAGLLGRADALLDGAASAETVLHTLDLGVDVAGSGPVWGELIVRRMRQRAETGDVVGALSDASTYTSAADPVRMEEVQRFAGWLALSEQGCEPARPWLEALAASGSSEEAVLLAECLVDSDADRARRLVTTALPALDDTWSARALRTLSRLTEAQ